jgi:hypothetical protein
MAWHANEALDTWKHLSMSSMLLETTYRLQTYEPDLISIRITDFATGEYTFRAEMSR